MKTLWISIILLFLVLAGSAALLIYTTILYNDLQDRLIGLQQIVEEEEWEKAEKEVEQLQEQWGRADASWTPIMDHRQVDRVDESFTRIFRLVDLRKKDDLLLEITITRRQLLRLKETEVPNLRNVF